MNKSADEQHRRLQFLRVDEDTRRHLRDFRAILEPRIDSILERFYAHLDRTPELAPLFQSDASIAHARAMQRHHWLENILGGEFGPAYFEQARKIGHVHEEKGLEPRWYLAAYGLLLAEFAKLAAEAYRWKPRKLGLMLDALAKAVFLDAEVAVSTYIDAARASAGRLLGEHADRFEQDLKEAVAMVNSAVGDLRGTSLAMAETATQTIDQARAVASAADSAMNDVESLAAAAEHLPGAVEEIARQVSQSTHIAGQAVEEARAANRLVQSLSDSATRIGEVVGVISGVAAQTNLLALNATIEAARAGEAGKGFAIVANEVKSLANQTAKATEDIAAQISAVQAATGDAVKAIESITATVERINEISSGITAAVEEQRVATQDIASTVRRAAGGTDGIRRHVTAVTRTAEDANAAAEALQRTAGSVSQQLDERVDHFLRQMRSAAN